MGVVGLERKEGLSQREPRMPLLTDDFFFFLSVYYVQRTGLGTRDIKEQIFAYKELKILRAGTCIWVCAHTQRAQK